jgi:hypothetical protein
MAERMDYLLFLMVSLIDLRKMECWMKITLLDLMMLMVMIVLMAMTNDDDDGNNDDIDDNGDDEGRKSSK